MDIEIYSKKYNNLAKEERDALYSLKDDLSGSVFVVWDREDYLKEAYKRLDDREVYEEVPNDPNVLIYTIMKALDKIHSRGNLSSDTHNYFLVKDPKCARFYLLPKIHMRLYDVPGKPVISNCGFYAENISSFFHYHFNVIIL